MHSTMATAADPAADARQDGAPQDGAAITGTALDEPFAVPGFDAVARLAAGSLKVPLVSLILSGGGAFWFTIDPHDGARVAPALDGVYFEAARRGTAQVVLDTSGDERFAHATLTSGLAPAPIRFFASEPVCTLSGRQVGALCVMDRVPHTELSEAERAALRDAAALAGASVVLGSYIGRTDPVTQLPHRNAFFGDLRGQFHDGIDHVWLTAIEVAPVERFNAFIRAMGHAYADELMRGVAQRIQSWLSPGMRLYQVGVTRFAVLLSNTHGLLETSRLDDLVARLRRPFECLNIPLTIQPGVGLLKVDEAELRSGDPLRLVMSASHAAQRSESGWALYDRDQDERHRHEFFLVTELAAALTERAELDLHYQPRIDLDHGRCVALEGLARWHHPTLGMVPPCEFIRLAESAGLMRALTEWVFDHGIAQLAELRGQGHQIQLSLNVSSVDFGADLVTRLQSAASRHGVDPAWLELEFTESTLMLHSDATRGHLAAIRQLGTGIAIDDFGTGYSNLNSLRQMPATCLKIDQSFVRAIHANPHDAAIVRSIAGLARDLGFRVVVEGVETRRVLDAVLEMACDEAQGFHLAPPMPASALPGWLAAHAPAAVRRAR
jgi:EAL domain-containing protein (putative c-di-GMP-specific phosphodiesterase class I)/GGDEF domain-containing protein